MSIGFKFKSLSKGKKAAIIVAVLVFLFILGKIGGDDNAPNSGSETKTNVTTSQEATKSPVTTTEDNYLSVGATEKQTEEQTAEPTEKQTAEPTEKQTAEPTEKETEKKIEAGGYESDAKYIINASSGKFHTPDCGSVKTMNSENRMESDKTRDELIEEGYEPCKRCNP